MPEKGTSERKPDLSEVLRRAIDAKLVTVRKMIPAKVTKWDAGKQKADVQPLIKEAFLDEEDERQVESLPVITGVPVVFQGGGVFRLTFPISDGSQTDATIGALVFSERSLDKWLTGSGKEVDPEIDHEHALADAIFIPGLKPFGAPWKSCPTDHATLGADEGVQVHLEDDLVTVAKETGNAKLVALAELVKARLDTIQGKYDVHKHTETGGDTGPPDQIIGALADVACQKLKAE